MSIRLISRVLLWKHLHRILSIEILSLDTGIRRSLLGTDDRETITRVESGKHENGDHDHDTLECNYDAG